MADVEAANTPKEGELSPEAKAALAAAGAPTEPEDDNGGKPEKVSEIEARIESASDEELDALAGDKRKGVQELVAAERERRAAASEPPAE